jgi:hypothetical protein
MIPLLIIQRPAKPVHVDAGEGMAVRKASGRHLLSVRRRREERFEGSWWVTLSGGEITVDRGYVNSMEPTIGGVPISGVMPDGTNAPEGRPSLSYMEGNIAWVVLKITPDASGKLNPKSGQPKLTEAVTVEVKGGFLGKASGDAWYYPLASVCKYGKVAQMAHFDLSYSTYKKTGDTKWRHRLSLEALTWRNLEEIIAEDKAIQEAIKS